MEYNNHGILRQKQTVYIETEWKSLTVFNVQTLKKENKIYIRSDVTAEILTQFNLSLEKSGTFFTIFFVYYYY